MAVSKSQQISVHKYVKANYDRMELTVQKGKREIIQAYAKSRGESTNAFINRAIAETMDRDTGAAPKQLPSQSSGSADGYLTAELLEMAKKLLRKTEGNYRPSSKTLLPIMQNHIPAL